MPAHCLVVTPEQHAKLRMATDAIPAAKAKWEPFYAAWKRGVDERERDRHGGGN